MTNQSRFLPGKQGQTRKVQSIFSACITILLHGPLEYQRYWLVLVRVSREIQHDCRIRDALSDPNSMEMSGTIIE